MKIKRRFIFLLISLILILAFQSSMAQYAKLLPYTPVNAEKDHYGGPACIQMACANAALHTQDFIYSKILMHNDESAIWYSDPNGIKRTLPY